MTPVAFSVTEVRVAATCPRISYFDFEHTRRHRLKSRSVTRLWKAGAEETACGALFHNAVEAFNRRALDAPEVRATVERESEPRAIERRLREFLNLHCVDLNALALRSVAQQEAFIRAVGIYMRELADIIGDARNRGKPIHEVLGQLFGDRRRRVDVTFEVGPNGEAVRITGILDYVFYDWRTAHHRIIDYKLTPAGEPSNDLFQVGLYALMHHVQHRTEPDVGVLYLHPDRLMVEMTWSQVHGQRHKLFDLLASMAEWQRYDEAGGKGLKPPGEPSCCSVCRWDNDGQCAGRLGPKHEGHRLRHWTDAFAGGQIRDEPSVNAEEANGTPRAWAQAVETETEEEPGPTEMVSETTNAPGLQEGSKKAQAEGRTAGRSDEEQAAIGEDVPSVTIRENSAQIGTTIVGRRLVAIPVAALPTHVAVVGAAGSGKTWLAKVLAEEAIRLEIPVLAIDPQGDLVQFLRPAAEFPDLTQEEKALRRGFLDRVEPRVWTPGSSHGRRLCLDPIRLAKPSDLAHITDPIRCAEEYEGMLAVVAAQLVATAKAGGETDSQQTFLLQALRTLAADPRGREVDLGTIAAVTSDPNSVGLENPDQFIKKSEREKLAQAQRASSRPGVEPLHGRSAAGPRRDVPTRACGKDDNEHSVPKRAGRRRSKALLYRGPCSRDLPLDDKFPWRKRGPTEDALLSGRGARLYPGRCQEASSERPVGPALHTRSEVRRGLSALYPESAIGRLQRLRQLQHQARRPPGKHPRSRPSCGVVQ